MRHTGRIMLGLIVAMLMATCVTVNVYFPIEEIEDAATQIEREVRSDAPADGPKPPSTSPGKQQSSNLWPRLQQVPMPFGPAVAEAQRININITTPAIRRLIASRKKRFPSLRSLLARCALGENNHGLLDLRPAPGVSLQDKARAKSLRNQENRDRQQLYRELATANNLPPARVGDIGRIFANVNRQAARSGWCIQDAKGNWKKK